MEEAKAKLGNNQVGRRPTKKYVDNQTSKITITANPAANQETTIQMINADSSIQTVNVPLSLTNKQLNSLYSQKQGKIILQSVPDVSTNHNSISQVATIVEVSANPDSPDGTEIKQTEPDML